MKKAILFIIIFLGIITTAYFSSKPTQTQNTTLQKCPDEYANTDRGSAEYLKDFDLWTNDFYDNNPEATLADWSKARYNYWVENDCQAAIARYNEAKEY